MNVLNNTPRLTPWFDWDEWTHVYQGLYSSDINTCSEAVNVVRMWSTRGKVPHSADMTAQLMSLQLRESVNHTCEQRLLYSIVIIRAVNGLVDHLQQGQFAESVLQIAGRIGLPGWIVELRHDATHNEAPSLSVLRAAARHLVQWFRQNYWEPQFHHIQSLSASVLPVPANASENPSQSAVSPNNFKAIIADASPTLLMEIWFPMFLELLIRPDKAFTRQVNDSTILKEESLTLFDLLEEHEIIGLEVDMQRLFTEWSDVFNAAVRSHSCFAYSAMCRLISWLLSQVEALHSKKFDVETLGITSRQFYMTVHCIEMFGAFEDSDPTVSSSLSSSVVFDAALSSSPFAVAPKTDRVGPETPVIRILETSRICLEEVEKELMLRSRSDCGSNATSSALLQLLRRAQKSVFSSICRLSKVPVSSNKEQKRCSEDDADLLLSKKSKEESSPILRGWPRGCRLVALSPWPAGFLPGETSCGFLYKSCCIGEISHNDGL